MRIKMCGDHTPLDEQCNVRQATCRARIGNYLFDKRQTYPKKWYYSALKAVGMVEELTRNCRLH